MSRLVLALRRLFTRREAEPGDYARVGAYGFDVAGFELPTAPVRVSPGAEVEFIRLSDAASLGRFSGLIVPSGVFEDIREGGWVYGRRLEIQVDEQLLSQRWKEVSNLLVEGGWVCFLIRKLYQNIVYDSVHYDVRDKDLSKRCLQGNGIDWAPSRETMIDVSTSEPEFEPYLKRYGLASTTLVLSHEFNELPAPVMFSGKRIVGLGLRSGLFFLPFGTGQSDAGSAASISMEVCDAIMGFRRRVQGPSVAWLDDLQFSGERSRIEALRSLDSQREALEIELAKYRGYKRVLIQSGDELRTSVLRILQDYFSLKIDAVDEGREDGRILNSDGSTFCFVEVKTRKGAVHREDVAQVDFNRSRARADKRTPGLLVVNCDTALETVTDRQIAQPPKDQIAYARTLNVLVLRTIDLLFLMLYLEPLSGRGIFLQDQLRQGGGWLNAGPDGYELKSA